MSIEQTNMVSNIKINFKDIIEESIEKTVSKGIAISTYFREYNESRLNTFKLCIDSLINTYDINNKIYLIDDSSIDVTHLNYVKMTYPNIEIHINNKNMGISKTKNKCIKILEQNNHDILFLSDDDVIFKDGWVKQYSLALLKSGVNMLMADVVKDKKEMNNKKNININNVNFKILTMPEGPFIAMTSKVPKTIGYFDEKLIYGYEHTYYTLNCLKHNLIPFNLYYKPN